MRKKPVSEFFEKCEYFNRNKKQPRTKKAESENELNTFYIAVWHKRLKGRETIAWRSIGRTNHATVTLVASLAADSVA